MHAFRHLVTCLTLAAILLLGGQAVADDQAGPEPPVGASLNEQVVRIPGDAPPAVTMQVTLMHPDGNSPFPLVVMNHGASGAGFGRRGPRYHLSNSIFYFLSRGYGVAIPMMRGFSTTGGEMYHFGCDLTETALANAKDIAAVIGYLRSDPRFDTRRVIVAGQSMGGWNTLAVGALGVPNVVGLVNFNGGLRESDCHDGDTALTEGAATFGATTRIPSIWFYGDNDQLFPSSVWHAMFDSYTRRGGRAEVIDVGTVMRDSHNFLAYPDVIPVWTNPLDAFLARIGMPHTVLFAHDLPTALPPPSHFNELTNVDAVPFLSPKGRDLYRSFLGYPLPRAFVISPGGGAASTEGGFDPLGRALVACRSAGASCFVYAVDNRVVFTPAPGSDDRAVTLSLPAGKTRTIDFAVRLNADCSPKTLAQFQIVQPPQHGRIDISQRSGTPHFPTNSAFAVCNNAKPLGTALDYTPMAGYSGADSFAFRSIAATGNSPIYHVNVTVRQQP